MPKEDGVYLKKKSILVKIAINIYIRSVKKINHVRSQNNKYSPLKELNCKINKIKKVLQITAVTRNC